MQSYSDGYKHYSVACNCCQTPPPPRVPGPTLCALMVLIIRRQALKSPARIYFDVQIKRSPPLINNRPNSLRADGADRPGTGEPKPGGRGGPKTRLWRMERLWRWAAEYVVRVEAYGTNWRDNHIKNGLPLRYFEDHRPTSPPSRPLERLPLDPHTASLQAPFISYCRRRLFAN